MAWDPTKSALSAQQPEPSTHCRMISFVRKRPQDALVLSEDERLELASEIIAGVDGPRDADREAAWLAELERRTEAAEALRGTAGSGPRRAACPGLNCSAGVCK